MITKVETEKGTRFLGITEEAKRLGVTHQHLYEVLMGRRASARILSEVRIREAVR